jgi:hypothetical protein
MSDAPENVQQVWKPTEAAQAIASRLNTIAQLQAYVDEVSEKYKDDETFKAELANLGVKL